MQFNEVLTKVAEAEGSLQFLDLSRSSTRIDGDDLLACDRRIPFTRSGLERLCEEMGAPASYLLNVSREVRTTALQYHLGRGDLDRRPMAAIVRGDAVVGFDRVDLMRLPGTQVLSVVAEGIEQADASARERLQGQDLEVWEGGFRLDLVGETAQREVAEGDILKAGLRISHSVLGENATTVEAYVLRLLCSNGMTHRDCVNPGASRTRRQPVNRPGGIELMKDQVRRLASTAWRKLDAKLTTIETLQREHVDIDQILVRWLERARLSGRNLMPRLRAAWEREGSQPTAYGAMNAVTRVATHDHDLSPRVRRVLAGLAGLLAFRQVHLCDRCFSLLGGSAASVDEVRTVPLRFAAPSSGSN